jgi:hypothetical protein
MYAIDILIFVSSKDELQGNLNILHKYCNRWKLCLNKSKTKVIVFRKGGCLPQNLYLYYDGYPLEIINKVHDLGIVFRSGGSFSETHKT